VPLRGWLAQYDDLASESAGVNYRVVLGGFSQNRVFARLLSRGGDGFSRRWRLGAVAYKGHGAIG